VPEVKVARIPYITCQWIPEEKTQVIKCRRCKVLTEVKCCKIPYTVCKMVPQECVKQVPCKICKMEAYCETYKVCCKVPVCVPVCEPCCPPPCCPPPCCPCPTSFKTTMHSWAARLCRKHQEEKVEAPCCDVK
jgi:hypothetical protein